MRWGDVVVPRGRKDQVRDHLAHLHRERLAVVAPLLAAMALYLVAVDLALVWGRPADPQPGVYLGADAAFLALQLGVWLAVHRARAVRLPIVFAYVMLVMVWAVTIALVEYPRTGNTTALHLSLFGASAFALFPLGLQVALVFATLGSYLVLATLGPNPDLESHISLLGLALMSFGVSRVLYRAAVGNYLANLELREARLGLIRQEKLASLGVLAAGIAHEVNNPLAFLQSNLATLERNHRLLAGPAEVVAEDQEIFEETRDGFRRITEVVKALGALGRDNPGDQRSPYDVNQGLRTTVSLTRHETQGRIEVLLNLSELPLVPARGSEINQVFLNLLLNAFRAVLTPGVAHPRVWIASRLEADAVVVEVSNNGPPIPQELREKIFEPFFSTKGPGEGLGLGLSLSWEIVVRRHRGSLELDQEPVTFRIRLPRK